MSGGKILDRIEIDLRDYHNDDLLTVYIDVFDNSLSRKWFSSLNLLLEKKYFLEKNYCFFGFADSERNGKYILDAVNSSINAINQADLGYHIDDYFDLDNTLHDGPIGEGLPGLKLVHERMNWLHRYFEDLQGVSGKISAYAKKANVDIQWHIRQLNLLCHEFESWALSHRQKIVAPQWQRPSQLMCWLNAPRFLLDKNDYELFGIETINRPLGGVFVGVNKAVGKHHWEVFNDEGRDSRIDELISTTMRNQTEAAGDFDIEWANNPGEFKWQKIKLIEFREWLINNGFDPEDKNLTIGHPQVGQVDLEKTFGSTDYSTIWPKLNKFLDVYEIRTKEQRTQYPYHWSDIDFQKQQIKFMERTQPCHG